MSLDLCLKGKRLGENKTDIAIKIEDCKPRLRDKIGIAEEREIYSKLGACGMRTKKSILIFIILDTLKKKKQRSFIFCFFVIVGEKSFNKNLTGIPIIYYYGKYNATYDVLVMTMIKDTIANEHKRLKGLSRETIFMVAIQVVLHENF